IPFACSGVQGICTLPLHIWKTLRFRLAAWNALVVVLTALAVVVGLRQGVRLAILHEMDQILLEDIGEIELALRELSPSEFHILTDELERKALGHQHHQWFVQLIDARGQVIWSSSASPPEKPARMHRFPAWRTDADNLRVVDRRVKSKQ